MTLEKCVECDKDVDTEKDGYAWSSRTGFKCKECYLEYIMNLTPQKCYLLEQIGKEEE